MWKRSRQTCSRMSMASFLARSLGVECVNNNKFQSACTSCLINIISKWRLKPLHMDTSSVHYYPPHPLYWKKKIGLDVNQHSRTSAILVQKGEENKWAESRGHCYSRIIYFSFFFLVAERFSTACLHSWPKQLQLCEMFFDQRTRPSITRLKPWIFFYFEIRER